LSKGLIKS